MSKNEAFFTWYEGMFRTIEDAHPFAELSFFHDHRTACKAAWDARSDLIPKLSEDVDAAAMRIARAWAKAKEGLPISPETKLDDLQEPDFLRLLARAALGETHE